MLEKGWNPRLPQDSLRKDLIDIHPTASSFKTMLDNARKHATRCMNDSHEYNKQRWDKSHKEPNFKIGDMVLVSTINFNNIKGPRKLKDAFAGPFVIRALHGKNAVEVVLTKEFDRKHPTFPVSLIKPYKETDKALFPLRTETEIISPPMEKQDQGSIAKVIKEKRVRGQKDKFYLVRYKDSNKEDEWLPEKEIPEGDKLLRRFRHDKRSDK